MCLPIYPSMWPLRSDYAQQAAYLGIPWLHVHPGWMHNWDEELVVNQLLGFTWQGFATKSTEKHCLDEIGQCIFINCFMDDLRLKTLFKFLWKHQRPILVHDSRGVEHASLVGSMIRMIAARQTAAAAGGCCCCNQPASKAIPNFDCCCWWLLLLLLLLLVLLLVASAAAAINQPLKQETNSQTPFSNHIRNSKAPPNFVPTMAQNHSQQQAPRGPNVPSEILLEIQF